MSEAMSRRVKLERWATVLEDCGATSLRPFHDLEFIAARDQDGLRVANSPLAMAYRDARGQAMTDLDWSEIECRLRRAYRSLKAAVGAGNS